MADLWERDAWDLADAVRAGELRATELVDSALARIDSRNPELNAVCFLDEDGARARAADIDARVAAGEDPGRLAGVPIGVKELAAVEGWPETHASLIYRDQVAPADSLEVARLRAAGAVIVGLTTASEFGSVSFINTKLHGVTRNPWNPERTCGGSSGGSAAAVAAGMLPLCTGGDGGGSIRIPSSYNGLPGFKGTYGRMPAGPGPFDASLTSVHGPIARSVRDAARYVDITAGPSPTDPTSLPYPEPYEPRVVSGELAESLRGKRAAWSSTLGYGLVDPEVEAITRDAAEALARESGLELVDVPVSLPKPGRAWSVLSSLQMCAFHYEDMKDRLDDLTFVVRLGAEAVAHITPDVMMTALRRRHDLLVAAAALFADIDLLLTPTTAVPAFAAEGEFEFMIDGRATNLLIASAGFTAPFNMTGQPGVSIPVGFVDGLPVGLQVVARRLEDELCFGAAAAFEQAHPWPKLAPGGSGR